MENKKEATSDVKSPTKGTEFIKILGGMPEKKTVEEIAKVNSPEGHKRAPGSVRV